MNCELILPSRNQFAEKIFVNFIITKIIWQPRRMLYRFTLRKRDAHKKRASLFATPLVSSAKVKALLL